MSWAKLIITFLFFQKDDNTFHWKWMPVKRRQFLCKNNYFLKCLLLPKITNQWLLLRLDSGLTIWVWWVSQLYRKNNFSRSPYGTDVRAAVTMGSYATMCVILEQKSADEAVRKCSFLKKVCFRVGNYEIFVLLWLFYKRQAQKIYKYIHFT